MTRRTSVRGAVVAALVTATAALATVPQSATASTAPTTITGVRVTTVTASAFAVRFNSLGSGWRYRLYASTRKSDIYYEHLHRAPFRSTISSSPQLSLSHLHYTTKPYWYRIQAVHGRSHRTGDILDIGLRPAMPTSLAASSGVGKSTSLTWSSGAVTGFTVQVSPDATFASEVTSYDLRGNGRQFTPTGLPLGSATYFRVRALNNGTPSGFTAPVSSLALAGEQPVRAMTYNLLTADADGQVVDGVHVPPWAPQRRDAAAQLAAAASPDVIGVQEASAWIGAPCTNTGQHRLRQIDSFVQALRARQPGGRDYVVAVSEAPPCVNGIPFFRAGVYVVYDQAVFAPAATAGFWLLPQQPGRYRYAAYQLLRHRDTGATFLFVSAHFSAIPGRHGDSVRHAEMQSVLQHARGYAHDHGDVPIVYAGDFNSHERHQYDGPAAVAQQAGLADGRLVAPVLHNGRYNSANGFLRTPQPWGLCIDHVYVEPGVGVTSWTLQMNLSHGRFAGVIPSDHSPVVTDLRIPYLPPYDVTKTQLG